MNHAPVEWLLAGPSWVEYRTRIDLLGQSGQDAQVAAARKRMLDDPLVQNLINEMTGWPGTVISSHKSAGQPFHKLTFLADLGIQAEDSQMDRVVASILKHQSEEGPFQLPMNIPINIGGTGEEQGAWALCDAPLVVYALVRFGLGEKSEVKKAVEYLAGLARSNGWPCAVSKELGKFRGPGRKEDPCPFANLVMLKALSEIPEWRDSSACQIGTDTLLDLWDESAERHPYMFFMGTDFRKLKVPLVWYDLVHVLEVLTRFPWLRDDARLLDMLAVLKSKMDAQGRFSLESVWTAWKDWEFGQKKEPSRWLTLSAWRIIGRIESE
jgi:hypothetical protein